MEQKGEVTQYTSDKITIDMVLFFDLDGTLIDTDFANFLSYQKAILTITKSDHKLVYDAQNRFNRSNLKSVIPNLTEAEYENIIQEKEKLYKDSLHETKLIEVIANILFKYSETNKTVLVTNCREERALLTLNYFGITDKFDNIFCRQIVDNDKKVNKFQNAISELGISPNFVVAFENGAFNPSRYMLTESEVIGNIYENQELLNG